MREKSSLITLFGATGYTGPLIAQALQQAQLPFRIAGRSSTRLEALSNQLSSHPQWLVADVADSSTLPGLFQNTGLLINCAGPFTDLGERVIAHAAMNGVHYLDINNELGYTFKARSYHELARRTGAALIPACGFEVAFADCLAALCGELFPDGDPLDRVDVVYALDEMVSSAGTRRSAVRSLATSWIVYRNGGWQGQIPGGKVKQFRLPDGDSHALSFPSCESITIPAHLQINQVDTWMTTGPASRFWAPRIIPLMARLSRSVLRGPILWLAAKGGASSASRLDGQHAESSFTIYVSMQRGSDQHWLALQGKDPYGLTAKLLAYYAARITAPEFNRTGLLPPAQAVDPHEFLHHAQEHWGVNLISA